jgi:DNA-binding NtrC family response regulator
MVTKMRLLAIDDDAATLALIARALEDEAFEITTAQDPKAGLEIFHRVRPSIVLLDLVMPSMSGLDLLERMVHADPAANVLLISGHYSPDYAVQAIAKGACDYLTKPLDIPRLRSRVTSLAAESEVRQRTLTLDRELVQACDFEGIVSRSPLMFEVFTKIRRVAPHFKTALITGPTGTGKELVARSLHRLSPSSNHKFVVCNCSTLVENLAESELFGHTKGAFTGAVQDKIGLFEHANGGVIFLDEVGELTSGMQAKLLRVLQDHEVRRVGSSVSRKVEVLVIAATNRNLRNLIREGHFREDLYYRLAVVEIELPPLANRREDLPLLQRHFVEKCAAEYKKTISGLTRRAQGRMATYSWPGNIRELENVIGNACMMTNGPFIDVDDLPERLRARPTNQLPSGETLFSLEEVQRRHVMRVLESVGGNKVRAAEILGIGRATIYEMLSKMRLEKTGETA